MGTPDFSDHDSCGIIIDEAFPKVKRPFKFFNFFLQNSDFLNLVREHWYTVNVKGFAMYRVSKNLKALKRPIKEFNKLNFSDMENRAEEAHDLLLSYQILTLADPNLLNVIHELEAQRKYNILAAGEECFFYQKYRVTWLDVGDGNTGYFHRMADSRKSINTISTLFDDNSVN